MRITAFTALVVILAGFLLAAEPQQQPPSQTNQVGEFMRAKLRTVGAEVLEHGDAWDDARAHAVARGREAAAREPHLDRGAPADRPTRHAPFRAAVAVSGRIEATPMPRAAAPRLLDNDRARRHYCAHDG